jgi:hypothetical protein
MTSSPEELAGTETERKKIVMSSPEEVVSYGSPR